MAKSGGVEKGTKESGATSAGEERGSGSKPSDSPSVTAGRVGGKDMKEVYGQIKVTVDISKVHKTANIVRNTNENHIQVRKLRVLFRKGKYGNTGDYISVTILGLGSGTTRALVDYLKGGGNRERDLMSLEGLQVTTKEALAAALVVYVDGMHRGVALLDEEVRKVTPRPVAVFYYRLDFEAMMELDVVTIGSALNMASSLSIHMTTQHKVNAMLSLLRSVKQLKEGGDGALRGMGEEEKSVVQAILAAGNEVDAGIFLKFCMSRDINMELNERQARKYCLFACGAYRFGEGAEKVMAALEGVPNINLVGSREVWKCKTTEEQVFMLKALTEVFTRGVLLGKRTRSDVTIPNEQNGRAVAEKARDLWNVVLEFALKKKIEVAELVRTEIPETERATHKITVEEKLVKWLGSYGLAKLVVGSTEKPENWARAQATFVRFLGRVWPKEEGAPREGGQSTETAQSRRTPPEVAVREVEAPKTAVRRSSRIRKTSWSSQPRVTPDDDVIVEEGDDEEGGDSGSDAGRTLTEENSGVKASKAVEADEDGVSGGGGSSPEKSIERSTVVNAGLQDSWMVPENKVEEGADGEGFRVAYRFKGGFVFNLPAVRSTGAIDVKWGDDGWWVGKVLRMFVEPVEMRLFEDREERYTKLNPSWVLDTEPVAGSKEERHVNSGPQWGCEGEIDEGSKLSVQKLLRCIGLRPPHRSMFLLETKDFIYIRRFLQWRILRECKMFGEVLKNVGHPIQHDDIAVEDMVEEVFNAVLEGHRKKLDSAGFVILDGVMKKVEVEEDTAVKRDGWLNMFDKVPQECKLVEEVQRLCGFYDNLVPSRKNIEERDLTELQLKTFRSIRSGVEGELPGIGVDSRLTSSAEAVTTMLEREEVENGVGYLRSRVQLDVAIMMLCKFLRLEYSSFKAGEEEGEDAPKLSGPDTGGRFIHTLSKTKTQIGHLDFHLPEAMELNADGSAKHPPYFAMVTGPNHVPLWGIEGSHKWSHKPRSEQNILGKVMRMKLMYVPPWSVIIVNGLYIHAGAGGMEARGVKCTRYHMYVLRKGIPLGDAINDYADFKVEEEDMNMGVKELVKHN